MNFRKQINVKQYIYLLFLFSFFTTLYADTHTIKQKVAEINIATDLDLVFPSSADIKLGDKPIMLIFGKKNCHYCDILNTSLISNPTLQGYISLNFTPYYIDLDGKKKRNIPYLSLSGIDPMDMARLYKITALPTIIFISGDGEEIMQVFGFPGEKRLIHLLEFVYNDIWKNFKTQKERVDGFLEYEASLKQ